MNYPLKILGLLYNDPKGKQLWELIAGFLPFQVNRQVLKNTLLSLRKEELIRIDPKSVRRHFIYTITPKGKVFFERNYLPLRLIEETKIKPLQKESDVT
jgi:DNA-binding PadR family transcriptional regulator